MKIQSIYEGFNLQPNLQIHQIYETHKILMANNNSNNSSNNNNNNNNNKR